MTPEENLAARIAYVDLNMMDVLTELVALDLEDDDYQLVLEVLRMAFIQGWTVCYNTVLDSLPASLRYK